MAPIFRSETTDCARYCGSFIYDDESLANAFADYFTDKISIIREELQLKTNTADHHFLDPPAYSGVKFCEFEPVTAEYLANLINASSLKSCQKQSSYRLTATPWSTGCSSRHLIIAWAMHP